MNLLVDKQCVAPAASSVAESMATADIGPLLVGLHALVLMHSLVPNVDSSMGRFAQMDPVQLGQLRKVTLSAEDAVLPERWSLVQVETLIGPVALVQM